MLALSRKVGERIFIGNGVVVTVIGVHGRSVCLGIDAPKSVRIQREEIRATPAALVPVSEEVEERRPTIAPRRFRLPR